MTGVGKRIEETVKALEGKQIKKALYLTDKTGMEHQHEVVQGAARACVENKDDKKACDAALKEARETLQASITATTDSTDLEGVEEMIAPKQEEPVAESPVEQPEEDLDCSECHVADAVVRFVQICDHDCNGETCKTMEPLLKDPMTPPEKWVKTMRQVASMDGCGQESYKAVLGDLEGYLKEKGPEILEKSNN